MEPGTEISPSERNVKRPRPSREARGLGRLTFREGPTRLHVGKETKPLLPLISLSPCLPVNLASPNAQQQATCEALVSLSPCLPVNLVSPNARQKATCEALVSLSRCLPANLASPNARQETTAPRAQDKPPVPGALRSTGRRGTRRVTAGTLRGGTLEGSARRTGRSRPRGCTGPASRCRSDRCRRGRNGRRSRSARAPSR